MRDREPFYRYRRAANLTIDQVADRLSVDRTTVIRWEKGEPRIPVHRLDAAAEILSVKKIDLRPDLLGETA